MFHFAACSGARLVNIVAEPQGDNPRQMELVAAPGESPQMITYHAGGNNCDFGATVGDCIYTRPAFTLNGIEYPPEYPDPTGPCAQRIKASNEYINNLGTSNSLYNDELNTLRDLLGHPTVKDNKDFRLYVVGYAHFFNTADNYCSKLSFAPLASLGGDPPKVSVILRSDINDAVERVNLILRKAVKDAKDPRVKFIDISAAFDKHRFCEDAHSKKNDQWYSKDVWLWNLNIPSNDEPANPELMDQWLNGEASQWFQANQPVEIMNGNGQTWTQRPFHPKKGGTEAIRDVIINQAREDRILGVKQLPLSSPPTGPPGGCTCNESGCSPESPACCSDGTC